jgi:hypothetical protein
MNNYRNSRYPSGLFGAQGGSPYAAMMRPNAGPPGAMMAQEGGPPMMKGSGDTAGIMPPMMRTGGNMAGPQMGMGGMGGRMGGLGGMGGFNPRMTMGPSSLGGGDYQSAPTPRMQAPMMMAQEGGPPMQAPQQAPSGPPQGINYSQLYANANNNAFRGDTAPMGTPDQSKGVVLAEGAQDRAGFVPPGGAFPEPTTPTYLNGMTALLYGGPNGPKAPPQDPRMVWGLGNAGGKPGYQLVNGYNGYKG